MRSIKWFHVLVLILVLFNTRTGLAAVILQYHHVSEKLPAVTSVSEATFRQHLNFLKSEQFSVIALDELIQQLQAGKTLPPKTVAITFDDGYLNNMEAAAPVLEQFGYPYTIFVNPKLIDEKKGYVMSWEQLRQLSKRGALIANTVRNMTIYTSKRQEKARRNGVAGSARIWFGHKPGSKKK